MKRSILMAGAALALAVSLTACSGRTNNDGNTGNDNNGNGSGTAGYYYNDYDSGYGYDSAAPRGRSVPGYTAGEYFADGEGAVNDWNASGTMKDGYRSAAGAVGRGVDDIGDSAHDMINDLTR